MTLKESMQKNIEAHANFVRNRDYEGGAEYFNKELLEHKQFEAAIYHAFFQIWLVYREDRTFDVKAFEETIETAFKLYPLSVERAIINEPDFQEENVSDELHTVINYLMWIITFFHESALENTKGDVLSGASEARGLCTGLHKLAFKVGDIVEEYFNNPIKVDFWKTGCKLMQLYEDAGHEEHYEAYHRRKLYTDKIRQVDTNFPEYELHYTAKSLEEKLEICKAEKKLKSGTVYSSYAEKRFVVPEGIEVIERSAISGSAIEEIIIPASVKRIEGYAFYQCKQLKKFIVPANSELESIGEYALYYTPLETIKIPRNCVVESHALFGCQIKYFSIIDKILQKIIEATKK